MKARGQAFVTTLDAHAEGEERDLFPPSVEMTEPEPEELGNRMLTRTEGLRAHGWRNSVSRPGRRSFVRCRARYGPLAGRPDGKRGTPAPSRPQVVGHGAAPAERAMANGRACSPADALDVVSNLST